MKFSYKKLVKRLGVKKATEVWHAPLIKGKSLQKVNLNHNGKLEKALGTKEQQDRIDRAIHKKLREIEERKKKKS